MTTSSGPTRNAFSQEEKNEASWTAEARDAADRTLDTLKATGGAPGEDSEPMCQIVILCSRANGHSGGNFTRRQGARGSQRTLDDVEYNSRKMATSGKNQMKIAGARFEGGARAARR